MKKLIIAPVAAVVMMGLSGYANATVNETGVDIYKKVHVTNYTNYYGYVGIGGYVKVNKLGMAVVDNEQSSQENWTSNNRNTNNAKILDGSASTLVGNVGVNVAAGDNNVQANNSAITHLGDYAGYYSKSSVDAEIASDQTTYYNITDNYGGKNNAIVGGASLNHIWGNVGVNVAAGSNNVQANNFALSSGYNATLAVSTVDNSQDSTYNDVDNAVSLEQVFVPHYGYKTVATGHVNNAVLKGGSLVGAYGNVGLNMAAGSNNLQSNSLALSAGNL